MKQIEALAVSKRRCLECLGVRCHRHARSEVSRDVAGLPPITAVRLVESVACWYVLQL